MAFFSFSNNYILQYALHVVSLKSDEELVIFRKDREPFECLRTYVMLTWDRRPSRMAWKVDQKEWVE